MGFLDDVRGRLKPKEKTVEERSQEWLSRENEILRLKQQAKLERARHDVERAKAQNKPKGGFSLGLMNSPSLFGDDEWSPIMGWSKKRRKR